MANGNVERQRRPPAVPGACTATANGNDERQRQSAARGGGWYGNGSARRV